jgi:hypothetical protein
VQLVLGEAGQQRAGQLADPGDQAVRRLVAQRGLELGVGGLGDERADAARQAERLQAPRELRALERAGDHLGEHVAGQPALGRVRGAAAQQLERDDRHRLVQQQAVGLAQAARVLDRHEPGLRHDPPAGGRVGHRQRERAPREVGVLGREGPAFSRARTRAKLGGQRRERVGLELAAERAPRQRLAAAVVHERGAADQGRQRAGDRVEPALGEHDAVQALDRGDRPAQRGVLLVDQLGERALGHRDEGQLVGHGEQRETARAGGLGQRLRHRVVPEAEAEPEPGEPVVGEALDERALRVAVAQRHARRQQQLAARQPRRRVGQLGDVHPAQGRVRGVVAREQIELEVAHEVADGEH